MQKKLKVGIIGTGNIGTDLLLKVLKSDDLECSMFIGRNLNSKGMTRAAELNVPLSDEGIDAVVKNHKNFDLIFDATTALSHLEHAIVFDKFDIIAIDMTPAKIGEFVIPAINIKDIYDKKNINMITCGGQASIPIAYCISQVVKDIEYIELVSTISSKSAGPGTRANIDEYIETTEKALSKFTGCNNVKAIINLNPAIPSIDMQTTIYIKAHNVVMDVITQSVFKMVSLIKQYVPGYDLVVSPQYINGAIIITIKVEGAGDYLPKYAGNLDIINCAAIEVAKKIAHNRLKGNK
ncbi:acetaldehyde dehydrogenase (acetylating) [Campylobacter californiensis]|uniref:acetaldehyde dehydrogenase (acetylating) n=1 Tax=Campylobacter californiensis TaxID=1032243 RepID=UPI0014744D6A|nr:acetaldehyde dehydrogenase (acetylating) [Campylobacter sp. RM12916]MBE3609022.1 acetaldehyde dehydrogenase (acetylating) [Campylobacter sp. RM12916]